MFDFSSNESFILSSNICVHTMKGISSFPILSSCLITDEASCTTKLKIFINAALKIGNSSAKLCNRLGNYCV